MSKRAKWLLAAPAIVVAGLGLFYLLYELPVWLDRDTLNQLEPKDRLAATATLRGQFVPLITVALGILGFVYTARGFSYTTRKFWLDRDSHYTDRFNTAIAYLDSTENPGTRAGGAWALQRIMEDSPRDRNRGRKALSFFLQYRTRDGGPATGAPSRDVADALEVLRAQSRSDIEYHGDDPLDLRGIRIPNADMHDMHLAAANLVRADLTNAHLRGSNLDGADLEQANLIGTNLREASLIGTRLIGARLATADLTDADLTDTDLTSAGLTDTVLTRANLAGADLRSTISLTAEQLATARLDSRTQLPPGLRPDHS
ncbi:pentapeptide repeat-containing protein [Nocardia vinacea]|uniref:pentapeptide repeat-containing protein n=1 Tax=Nocardia vinacea TaxID=96468 RepID=UPI0033F12FA2